MELLCPAKIAYMQHLAQWRRVMVPPPTPSFFFFFHVCPQPRVPASPHSPGHGRTSLDKDKVLLQIPFLQTSPILPGQPPACLQSPRGQHPVDGGDEYSSNETKPPPPVQAVRLPQSPSMEGGRGGSRGHGKYALSCPWDPVDRTLVVWYGSPEARQRRLAKKVLGRPCPPVLFCFLSCPCRLDSCGPQVGPRREGG